MALPGGQASGAGETWRATFSWPGDPGEITGAALEVGGSLLVDLPLPDRKRRRRRRSSQDTSDDVLRGEVGALRAQIERLRAELAGREREIIALREQADAPAAPAAAAFVTADEDAPTMDVARLEGELAELRDAEATRAEDMTIEIDRLSQERDAAHAAADEAVAAERERWQVELADLRESFADAAAEVEATHERHLAEVAELEAQLRIERAEVARLLAAAADREAAPAPVAAPAAVAPVAEVEADAPEATEPKAQDTVETDVLDPPAEPTAEATPTARFTAWVRETIGPELGAAPPAVGAPEGNGTVARDAEVTSWLRGATTDAPVVDDDEPDAPELRGSRIPAWLRGRIPPPVEHDEPVEDADTAGEAPPAPAEDAPPRESRIPAWLRGGTSAPTAADPPDAAEAPTADTEPADEDAGTVDTIAEADAVETPAADTATTDTATTADDDAAGDDTVAEAVADDARADDVTADDRSAADHDVTAGDGEFRAAALDRPAAERYVDGPDTEPRGVAWPKLDTETFTALRDRFRRPERDPVTHDETGEPLARPIRTRTERRVRHGATIAAGSTSAEVWALRVAAAILVAVLLTAFVLLLAYLA